MRVVVTGTTGLIGSTFVKAISDTAETVGLTRGVSTDRLIHTDYLIESLTDIFEQADIVVHLAAVRGKSQARRDFIYLKDAVGALCWSIFEERSINQIYNLGGVNAYTNI